MPLNACELEIDLFCRGLRVPSTVSLEGARSVRRTRAGLGSGLELVIPTGSRLKPEIWMNAPVAEPRTATVRAVEDTTVLSIARRDFTALVENLPILGQAFSQTARNALAVTAPEES